MFSKAKLRWFHLSSILIAVFVIASSPNAVIASTTNVPYYYFNNNFSVTKDGYGNKIPVGHLANSQEICSILQHPLFQTAVKAGPNFYFLDRESLLVVLNKTIETEWQFPNTLYGRSPYPPDYTQKVPGNKLKHWMLDQFKKQNWRGIERAGGNALLSIQEMSKSNNRRWKNRPPADTIFLENAWAGCLRTIKQKNPPLFKTLFQRNVFVGWISSHCLERKKKTKTFIQDGKVITKTVYEPNEKGCAHPRYGGVLSPDGLLFFLTSHREGHKWLLPMLDHFQKNLEKQIVVADRKIEQEKRQQEEVRARAKVQAEQANKPENQLATGYISYLRIKACYEARKGYAAVFINDHEMDIARKQIKSVEKAITAQHQLDTEKVWKFSENNKSPLGGIENAFGGLAQYLSMEAQRDFQQIRGLCQVWRLPLSNLVKKWYQLVIKVV